MLLQAESESEETASSDDLDSVSEEDGQVVEETDEYGCLVEPEEDWKSMEPEETMLQSADENKDERDTKEKHMKRVREDEIKIFRLPKIAKKREESIHVFHLPKQDLDSDEE